MNLPERAVTRGIYHCPWCSVQNDAALAMQDDGNRPNVGDVSVCWNCGSVALFDNTMHLRRPRPDESADILDNPMVTAMRAEIIARRRENDD